MVTPLVFCDQHLRISVESTLNKNLDFEIPIKIGKIKSLKYVKNANLVH